MADDTPKKKILVVDDELGILTLLKASLIKNGYDVMVGHNGLEALASVRQSLPDLIIIDRMMPKMDGLKASALLKADKRFCRIPIIMLTASAEAEDQKLSQEAGADAFLNKPVDITALLQKIQELLAFSWGAGVKVY